MHIIFDLNALLKTNRSINDFQVVPWDIHIETTSVKSDQLESLINDRTVAILIAHLFGKWCNIDDIIDTARRKNIQVIEDCAESFCGFEKLAHPNCDISLFSFGVIKYYTAFGGAIAKVKNESVYKAMSDLASKYPVQTQFSYLKKILKYTFVYILLDCPSITHPFMYVVRTFNIDHKKIVIKFLRGFPDQLIERIRQRPSLALLKTMIYRLSRFDQRDFETINIKGDYVKERLPDTVTLVGSQTEINNYWLFPILVVRQYIY